MPVKRTLAVATLAGVALFGLSAPAAPALDKPVSSNGDSTFTLIRGGGGGGGHGGGHGGFGGGIGGGRGYAMGGFGGQGFSGRAFTSRSAFRGNRSVGRGRIRHQAGFRHGHRRHRVFVGGIGWVSCIWPYNWGPYCDY
jgi:hypothetical protein